MMTAGSDRDGGRFTVAERRSSRNEGCVDLVLGFAQGDESNFARGGQLLDELMLAVDLARLVLQLCCHDFWYQNVVRHGGENTPAMRACMEVYQDTRVDDQRDRVISQGA